MGGNARVPIGYLEIGMDRIGLSGKQWLKRLRWILFPHERDNNFRVVNNKQSPFHDIYTFCLKVPASTLAVLILFVFCAIAIAFALLYAYVEAGGIVGINGSSLRLFLFSLSLTTGFGATSFQVESTYATLLANVQQLVMQMMLVFITGVVFARLSRPRNPILISKKMVQSYRNGYPSLQLRIALTNSPPQLVDARLTLTLGRNVTLPNGSFFRQNSILELSRSSLAIVKYMLSVSHDITPSSPLHGLSRAELLRSQATLGFTVTALENVSGQEVFARASYAMDDVLVDWAFEDMLVDPASTPDDVAVVDVSRIDCVVPLTDEQRDSVVRASSLRRWDLVRYHVMVKRTYAADAVRSGAAQWSILASRLRNFKAK